jgi:hypothetical protein
LECGGQRQRDTALHLLRTGSTKAPSPLRSAGALQKFESDPTDESPDYSRPGRWQAENRATIPPQMSTKATIAHGPNFHLYHDLLDEDSVYLELEGTQFEAGYNRVMVPIPVHVWEVIRQYPGIDLEYADKTDAELSRLVEQQVDDRIKQYAEADEKAKGLVSLFGSLAFGTADQPREQQIAAGLDYFSKVRRHQLQIKQAIAELEAANARTPREVI